MVRERFTLFRTIAYPLPWTSTVNTNLLKHRNCNESRIKKSIFTCRQFRSHLLSDINQCFIRRVVNYSINRNNGERMVISSTRCVFYFLMPHFSFRFSSRSTSYINTGSSSIDVSALVVKSSRCEVDVKYGDKATTTRLLHDTRTTYRISTQLLTFMFRRAILTFCSTSWIFEENAINCYYERVIDS